MACTVVLNVKHFGNNLRLQMNKMKLPIDPGGPLTIQAMARLVAHERLSARRYCNEKISQILLVSFLRRLLTGDWLERILNHVNEIQLARYFLTEFPMMRMPPTSHFTISTQPHLPWDAKLVLLLAKSLLLVEPTFAAILNPRLKPRPAPSRTPLPTFVLPRFLPSTTATAPCLHLQNSLVNRSQSLPSWAVLLSRFLQVKSVPFHFRKQVLHHKHETFSHPTGLTKTQSQATAVMAMCRSPRVLRHAIRRLLSSNASGHDPKKRIWDRASVDASAAERKRHASAVDSAKWVSSWMMPWERAQMDFPSRPLKLWERVYWRLFVVLGGVGFAYETWVLGNRRILLPERSVPAKTSDAEITGLYAGNQTFHSQRLFTDEEIQAVPAPSE